MRTAIAPHELLPKDLHLESLSIETGRVSIRVASETSGTRGRRERRDFDRMFADAARRRFDVLLFWSLDPFSREGTRKTIAYLQRLDECGVSFRSYTEPFLDTDNELIAHIDLGVTSYYA